MSTKVKTIYGSETFDELQAELQKLAKEKPTKVDRQKMIALLFEDIKEALKIHTYEVVAARLTDKGFEVSAGGLRQIISRHIKVQADKVAAETQVAVKPKRARKPKAEVVSDKVVKEEIDYKNDKKTDAMPPEDSQVDNQSDIQTDETKEVETVERQKAEKPKKRGAISTHPQTDESNAERDEVPNDSPPVNLLDVI